ncbi:hypothetical protein CAC42_3768 [Sphaceloma murrayae]|uniref:Uncharacterized protein n=1 Tax=Sphaceloma murrayae TaxID=2082308 RepID=A0A2K1QHW6_9PEZI|nr:hypothetical protein CAC42_3768 [Sphaceloma murrayae]
MSKVAENPFEVAEREARNAKDNDNDSLYAASDKDIRPGESSPWIAYAGTSASAGAPTAVAGSTLTAGSPPPGPLSPVRTTASTTSTPSRSLLDSTNTAQHPDSSPSAPNPAFTPVEAWSNRPSSTIPDPPANQPFDPSLFRIPPDPAHQHLISEFYSPSPSRPATATSQHYAYLRSHLRTVKSIRPGPATRGISSPSTTPALASHEGESARDKKRWFRRSKAAGSGPFRLESPRNPVGEEEDDDEEEEEEEEEEEDDAFERYQLEVLAAKRGAAPPPPPLPPPPPRSTTRSTTRSQTLAESSRGRGRGAYAGGGGGSNYANKLAGLEIDEEVEEYRREVWGAKTGVGGGLAREEEEEEESKRRRRKKGKGWFSLSKGKERNGSGHDVSRVSGGQTMNVRWG